MVDLESSDAIEGLTVTTEAPASELGRLVGPDDAFAAMNLAYSPGAVFVDVAANARIDQPVVLLVDCPDGASFPRVLVRVGERGRSLGWPNEIDFCADALWFEIHPEDSPRRSQRTVPHSPQFMRP